MLVRAHHLLCALQFRGYGYSEAFVRRVSRVIALWRRRPGLTLTLTRSHDAWCRACPNRSTPSCRQAAGRDARALACLGLAPGDRLEVAAARELVKRKIDARAATYICTGCRWLDGGYCRW